MHASTKLPLSFRSEVRLLRGPVPTSFETFYRGHLRYRSGGRIRSADVWSGYSQWAMLNEVPGLHPRELCRAMLNIGHSYFKSNGSYFRDVVWAREAPDLPDNFPRVLNAEQAAATLDRHDALLARVDRALAEMSDVRAALLGSLV